MIRRFQILDSCRKDAYMGELQYNTETKQFRVLILDDYPENTLPDFFMEKFKGQGELPDWIVDKWITRRLMPPNRHAIKSILEDVGLTEYDEMGLFDITKGRCDKDSFYFKEIK